MSVEVTPDGVMAYTTIGLVEQTYLQTSVPSLSSRDDRKEYLDHAGNPALWWDQCSSAFTLLPRMAWEMRRPFKCQACKDVVILNRVPGDFFSKDLKKAREGENKMYSWESRRRARSSCMACPNSSKESGVTWRRVKGKAQVMRLGKWWGQEAHPRRASKNTIKALVIKLSEKGFKQWSHTVWLLFDVLPGCWGRCLKIAWLGVRVGVGRRTTVKEGKPVKKRWQ